VPPRNGSDARAILAGLGYTAADLHRLIASGIVGPNRMVSARFDPRPMIVVGQPLRGGRAHRPRQRRITLAER